MRPATSPSFSGPTPSSRWWPGPRRCRSRRGGDWSVRPAMRSRPRNVTSRRTSKSRWCGRKGFKNFILQWEDLAEFEHRPDLCRRGYRMVVLRKRISVEQGQEKLFEEYRYFFYITNDRARTAQEVVFAANDRCDQENLIEQLKNGVRSMRNPLDNLHSNWAYMVIEFSGLDAEGLVRPAAAGDSGALARAAGGPAADGREDGVQAFRRQPDPPAVPDHQGRPADRVSAAELEPVGGSVCCDWPRRCERR